MTDFHGCGLHRPSDTNVVPVEGSPDMHMVYEKDAFLWCHRSPYTGRWCIEGVRPDKHALEWWSPLTIAPHIECERCGLTGTIKESKFQRFYGRAS